MSHKHIRQNKLMPRFLLLFFLYSAAFALFLLGIRLFLLEQRSTLSYEKSADSLSASKNGTQLQQNIAKNIIRLHVIANSDSPADQCLKLRVRNSIISSLQERLRHASSVSEAERIIRTQQAEICNTAQNVLTTHQNSDPVKVSLRTRYFPVRQYGDLTFPAGTYQALCIELGKAEGRNWWCVLFPSLCFVDETTAVVPDSSKEKLQERLSDEEYSTLLAETPSPDAADLPEKSRERPELHFAILDWLKR